MVGHSECTCRCHMEWNVPIAIILPRRWQDGAESLLIETTSCLWSYLDNLCNYLHFYLLPFIVQASQVNYLRLVSYLSPMRSGLYGRMGKQNVTRNINHFKQSIFVEQSTKLSGRSFFLDNEMKYFSLFELIKFLRKELRPESSVPFGFGWTTDFFFKFLKPKNPKFVAKCSSCGGLHTYIQKKWRRFCFLRTLSPLQILKIGKTCIIFTFFYLI